MPELEMLLALAAVANRLSEYVRGALITPLSKRFQWDADTFTSIMLIISGIVGVLVAFGAQANILNGDTAFGHVPVPAGVAFTGILFAGGANALQHVYDALYGFKQQIAVPTATITQTSTEHSGGDTTVTKVETTASVVQPSSGANAS